MSDEKKRDARSLVSSIMSKTGGAPTLPDDSPLADEARSAGLGSLVAQHAAETSHTPKALTPKELEDEATSLIDVYFELEDAHERDVVFDKLTALATPVVDKFLHAMMEEDEDEYVRAAAAGELARRGSAEALAALEGDLADPQEPYFFTHAIMVLSEVRGPAFFDTLRSIWQDPTRDADQRREAMLGLEGVDTPRALTELVAFIDAQRDIDAMPDDQIEIAMMVFVRQGHAPAVTPLRNLQARVQQANLDADEKEELVGFLQEGIDLLV